MESQFESLSSNPDVIIATPGNFSLRMSCLSSSRDLIKGRLRHMLVEIESFSLKKVTKVIFDEGDRLFEMGFADDIKFIMDHVFLPLLSSFVTHFLLINQFFSSLLYL